MDLGNEDELANVLAYLKGIKPKRSKRIMTAVYILVGFLLSVVISKAIGVGVYN